MSFANPLSGLRKLNKLSEERCIHPLSIIASRNEKGVAAKEVSLPKKLILSGISGAVATTCIYPIDFVKTSLQDDSSIGAQKRFSGPADCVMKIARSEGIRGFYKGYAPNVILVMPEKALKLTLNEYFRSKLSDSGRKELGMVAEMVAGGLAGLFQVSVTNPMELLKIQGATMAKKLEEGVIKEAVPYSKLIRGLGFTGLYTGVVATLARDIPFSMAYFSIYAKGKEWLMPKDLFGCGVGLKAFIAGCAGGTFAAGMTTPLDVIKTRVHSQAIELLDSPNRPSGLNYVKMEFSLVGSTFRTILKEEGARAMWKGIVPRCIIIAPLFGITMNVYEILKEKFA